MKKAMAIAGVILVVLVGIPWGKDELSKRLTISLREAARAGDVARTTDLLRWSWLYDLNRYSVLQGASEEGHADIVALLIDAGVEPDWTDLWRAAEAGHSEVVAHLIDGGVDLNSGSNGLAGAASRGHSDVVDLLIEAGADINRCSSNRNGVSGAEAAIGNALGRIVGSPQRMEARAHSGPLYAEKCYPRALDAAIEAGHTDIAAALIAAGSNVMAKNYLAMGRTPVELAYEEGQPDMIQLLDSALELPLAGNVINAAEAGDWDRLSRVVALGADVNEPETWSFGRSYGRTALMYAALSGRANMVATLLQAGADVTLATPQDSATALSLATDNGHDEVVELLLAAGAQS